MIKRGHFRIGSNKWNPTIYKGGTEYKAVNVHGYYAELDSFFDVRFSFTAAELQAMSPGDKIYYDESHNRLTTTAGTNTLIGTIFWDYNTHTYDEIPCRRVAGCEILNVNFPDTGKCQQSGSSYMTVKIAQSGSYGAQNKVCSTSSVSDGYHNCCAWYDLLETLQDKSWKTSNTISNSTDLYPAMMLAYRYHTAGTFPGYWYIPASANLRQRTGERDANSEYYFLWQLACSITSGNDNCLSYGRFEGSYGFYDHQSSYEYSATGAAMFSAGNTWGCAYSVTTLKTNSFARWPVMQLWPKERMAEKKQTLTYYHLN